MAFVIADRVKETTTTTGTGAVTLLGAATGYQSFSVIGNTNTTYYAIIDSTNNVWETGLGTYSTTGPTLTRTTVYANSSGTTSALTLAAGTKDVICTQPANTSITTDVTILGGNNAGKAAPSGITAIGSGALSSASATATNTVAIGKSAFLGAVSGANNVGVGYNVGANLNTGANNVIVGSGAAISLQGGGNNTLIGQGTGGSISSGNNNTVIGQSSATGMTGSQNTVLGVGSGASSTGSGNLLLGYQAGVNISGGFAQNVFVGYQTGFSVGATFYNVILGGFQGTALNFDMTASNNNVAISDGQGNLKSFYSATIGMSGHAIADRSAASATAATGTIAFYTQDQQILYYTSNATANFTLNVRGSASVTLNNGMATNQTVTIQFWNTNGASAFYMNAFQIDGAAVTPKWITGTAPTTGNANAIDVYTIEIMKTAASTFTVLARQDKYA